jgi:hypothetical protein
MHLNIFLQPTETWDEAQEGRLKKNINNKESLDVVLSVAKDSTNSSTSKNKVARVQELQPPDSQAVEADPLGRGKREKIRKTVFSPMPAKPKNTNVATKEKPNEIKKPLRPLPRTPLGLLDPNIKANISSNNRVGKGNSLKDT